MRSARQMAHRMQRALPALWPCSQRLFLRRASAYPANSPAAKAALDAWAPAEAAGKELRAFVERTVAQLKPDRVMLCDGSAEEVRLCAA